MPEDQLAQLPPELRTMVMTGATAMMANGGAPMMQPAMNPMMAPEMGNMNMGPQMMNPMMASMGGEMGMDGVGVGVGAQQGQGGPMQDQLAAAGVEGFGPQGAIGVNMAMAEYGLQVCVLALSFIPAAECAHSRIRVGCSRCNHSSSNNNKYSSSNSSSFSSNNKCNRNSSNNNSFSNNRNRRCNSSSSNNSNNNICIRIWRPPSRHHRP